MPASGSSANPFQLWAEVNAAALSASMEMANAAASTMTSLWTSGNAAPTGARALNTIAQAAHVPAATRASSTAAAGRSWYRAPYRSPFDPLFWMMPGHPVDHMADWLAPMATASAMLGNPYASALANGLSAWPATAWMAPFMAWPDISGTVGNARGGPLTTDNVIDFDAAYSSYRTAGGHASAPIVRDRTAPEPLSPKPARTGASALPWLLPFALWGLVPQR